MCNQVSAVTKITGDYMYVSNGVILSHKKYNCGEAMCLHPGRPQRCYSCRDAVDSPARSNFAPVSPECPYSAVLTS